MKFCAERGDLGDVCSQKVLWCHPKYPTYTNQKAGFWQLIKAKSGSEKDEQSKNQDDNFMIGMDYGDIFPRIVATVRDNKTQQQNILVSTRWADNIYEPEFTNWQLEIKEDQ